MAKKTYSNAMKTLVSGLSSQEKATSGQTVMLCGSDGTPEGKVPLSTSAIIDAETGDALSKTEAVPILYADLVTKKTNSGLVPGRWYRITDYVTTTVQENTQSAGHQFDVIVRADSTNTLNENAYAARHAGDTYFANSRLEAWELKYCLDNINWSLQKSTTCTVTVENNSFSGIKYIGTEVINGSTYHKWDFSQYGQYIYANYVYTEALANGDAYANSMGSWRKVGTISDVVSITEEGKGTIAYLRDEYDNECPYDFKNIQFKWTSDITKNGIKANVFYYTFSVATGTNDATVTDHSLNGSYCYSNKIGKYIESGKHKINANVFRNGASTSSCSSNTFGNGCFSNTFGSNCSSNTFGNGCFSNTFGSNCGSNTFMSDCHSNTFGNGCVQNTFGSDCYYNTFGDNCYSNTFGSSCHSNTFGDYYQYNTFGNSCYSNAFMSSCHFNAFGNSCSRNAFMSSCHSNTFGNGCVQNTFGSGCCSNTFGSECYSNTFGDSCIQNTFGSDCRYIKFGTSSTKKNYCRFITIENGNSFIYLNCSATTSDSSFFQNVKIAQGVNNTDIFKTITHTTAGDTFQTVYRAQDSQDVYLSSEVIN